MIRNAEEKDINNIIELEKKYYDGYSLSKELLLRWTKNGNFHVTEENSEIVGSIYFEFLDEIKDLPWHHEPIVGKGKYVYISEVSTSSDEINPELFDEVLKAAKENGCKAVVWLTEVRLKHDQIEQKFLKASGFEKYKDVENWECSPGYFVSDHALWLRKL